MLSSRENFLQVSIGSSPFWRTFEKDAEGERDLTWCQVRKVRRLLAETQPAKSPQELLSGQ